MMMRLLSTTLMISTYKGEINNGRLNLMACGKFKHKLNHVSAAENGALEDTLALQKRDDLFNLDGTIGKSDQEKRSVSVSCIC